MINIFRNNLNTKPLYLLLLPFFFALHGYNQYFDLVPLKDTLKLGLNYAIVSLILFLICLLIYKKYTKAGILSFLILSFQLFFGNIQDFLKSLHSFSFLSKYTFILPISFIAFIVIAIKLKKTANKLHTLTQYLNGLFFVLLLYDIGAAFINNSNKKIRTVQTEAFGTNCDTCSKKDIYLIVADGYPGKTELIDLFNFNNTPFEEKLKQRNFNIVDSSISNYNFTPFSIASMLEMDYLTGILGSNSNKNDIVICRNTIKESKALKYLISIGYNFYNYSIFDFNGQPSITKPTFLQKKTSYILAQTFLHRLQKDLGYHLITTFKLKYFVKKNTNFTLLNNNKVYDSTIAIAQKKELQPKFVYTHLVMPHYPYYFDKYGKQNDYALLTDEHIFDKSAFIEYLQFSNTKLLELVDKIKQYSATPPIILLISDHGFREFKDSVDKKYYFMNFKAVNIPESNYSNFYTGFSNVNLFGILFNTLYNQKFTLLKDSTSFLNE